MQFAMELMSTIYRLKSMFVRRSKEASVTLPLTLFLVVFSLIVEKACGKSFPLEQRCSSLGLRDNGIATE